MTAPALTPRQVLAAARYRVCERAPYFAAGVALLVPREAPGLGTFATSKDWVMYWDPDKAAEWGVEGTAAVVAHELYHLVFDHFGRFDQPGVNHDLANISGDLCANPAVAQMGFQFPEKKAENLGDKPQPTGLWPETFGLPHGLSAEQYYAEIEKMDVRYVYLDAAGGVRLPGGSVVIVEGCGSCSGRKRADEPEDAGDGRTQAEIQRTRVTIARAVQQQGRGSAPSDLARWASEVLTPPKVDWRKKLARACRASVAYRPGAEHATYARPSRRQTGLGFGPGKPSLPSWRATRPRATLLVDTSGSMSQEQLALAMGEAQGILQVCGAQLDVVVCDAAVHGAREVRSVKEACAMLRGGGGSNFNPAFEMIEKKKPKVDVVVAATDGDIDVPTKEPPGTRVIWLLVGRYSHPPAKWGEVVEVDT